MRNRKPPVNVIMLVFGFAGAAQFSITAGNISALPEGEIETLQHRASDIVTLSQSGCHIVSSAFRLGRGEVLMLGIPVAEPEKASGRNGLCVVFTVFVSRRQVASSAMLVQMLACLELAVAQECQDPYVDPSVTADLYTRRLQRREDDPSIDSASRATEEISLIFTKILSVQSWWHRMVPFSRRSVDSDGVTVNNSDSEVYYAVASEAVKRRRISRKGQICYYLPLTSQMVERLKGIKINSHLLRDTGIILGHTIRETSH
jgi:hypothetical protein